MRGQALCRTVVGRGPPPEAALRNPLVAKPKSLAVVHQQLHGRRLAIAEDEDGSGAGAVPEGLLGEPGQAVGPATKTARTGRGAGFRLEHGPEDHQAARKSVHGATTAATS